MRRPSVFALSSAALAAATLLLASSAHAQCPGTPKNPVSSGAYPTLFHTDQGPPYVDHGTVTYIQPAARTLNLVLNPGTVANTSGTICGTGNGDNVCGLMLDISVDGDLTLSETGYTSLISGQLSKHALTSQRLCVAIVTTGSPLPPGPTLLGTLSVGSGPHGGAVKVSALQTVDANLDLKTAAPRALAFIPEPEFGAGLAAGLLALALLERRRARQGGVR